MGSSSMPRYKVLIGSVEEGLLIFLLPSRSWLFNLHHSFFPPPQISLLWGPCQISVEDRIRGHSEWIQQYCTPEFFPCQQSFDLCLWARTQLGDMTPHWKMSFLCSRETHPKSCSDGLCSSALSRHPRLKAHDHSQRVFLLFFLGACWTLTQINPLEFCLDLFLKSPKGPSYLVFLSSFSFLLFSFLFPSDLFTPFSENVHVLGQPCPCLEEGLEGRGCASIPVIKQCTIFWWIQEYIIWTIF